MIDRVGLAEWRVVAVSVNARARSVHKTGGWIQARGGFEPGDGANHVHVGIKPGILDAGPHPGACGQVSLTLNGKSQSPLQPPDSYRATVLKTAALHWNLG